MLDPGKDNRPLSIYKTMTKAEHPSAKTTKKQKAPPAPNTLGWREWVSLPELGIPAIKAKIDTGAKTSALHAFRIEPFVRNKTDHVRFWLHPLQNKRQIELECEAPVIQKRTVKNSGGQREERYVIESTVCIGKHTWAIEMTLTSREDMMFRMLLGRTAIRDGKLKIDPAASYLTGRGKGRIYTKQAGDIK